MHNYYQYITKTIQYLVKIQNIGNHHKYYKKSSKTMEKTYKTQENIRKHAQILPIHHKNNTIPSQNTQHRKISQILQKPSKTMKKHRKHRKT